MRRKIAVVVPEQRPWGWHQNLIVELQQSFDVDVYSTRDAPSYPLSLKFWLRLEQSVLDHSAAVKIVEIAAEPWVNFSNAEYVAVLNLSEAPIKAPAVPILEPRYNGQIDSASLLRTLLQRKNPYLSVHVSGEKEPRVASYPAIQNKKALIRGLETSFARIKVLVERALDCSMKDIYPPIALSSKIAYQTTAPIFSFGLLFLLDKLFGRFIRRFQVLEHWSAAILWSDHWLVPNGVPLTKFVSIADDGDRYYADPFPFNNDGEHWLFVEEYKLRSDIGIISCMPVAVGGKVGPAKPVLIRPYHLSHPFLFRNEGAIYMLPESGGYRTVELYRARSFPFDWVLHQVLMIDVEIYDATLLRHADRWWMFGTIVHDGGSHHDELAIFYSDQLEGPWKPHKLNPVKSDCRSARPAGQIVRRGDRLLRPAQDCETGYGAGIVWTEIEELTTENFKEREIVRWSVNELGADGLHTFNLDHKLGAIDVRHTKWSMVKLRSVLGSSSGWGPSTG